ncbi:MAG: ankyrin repeat domain-containing protein [Deltaproteobacteria bacterium]|nr:MAG: ankyrin repeat domain-containing protein [Deltaproteobacteria bacterium]
MKQNQYHVITRHVVHAFILFISFQLITGCTTMTPLIKASKDGDVQQIRSLLSQSINVNERTQGKYPTSAIHWASYSGSIDAVSLLLESGANVNDRDYCGQTPLIYAAHGYSSERNKLVSFLISKGADPEIVDCYGCTVFSYSDNFGDKALINALAEIRSKSKKTGIVDPDFQPYKPTIDYKYLLIKLNYKGSGKVVFMVQDKRPYILAGEKQPEYVGYFRNANFGIPYDATTPNKNPLSEALSSRISESLKMSGYDVIEVRSKPTDTDTAILEKMKQYGTNKIIIMTLREWLSEAYYNVALTYDVGLTIMDESGNVIAIENIKGSDDLGDRYWRPEIRAKVYVPEAAQKKLEELFNKQEIIKSLTMK